MGAMRPGRLPRILLLALAITAIPALAGCGVTYLWQAAAGQFDLLHARQPIAAVLADPGTDRELRARLALVAAAVDFAHAELHLPDNGSYRDYADLGRPYAVWNVFAAPEFSLELRRSCFPVAGCVGYRGYFSEAAARAAAAERAAEGDGVFVAGVPAYSTLGYFHDPVLSTVLRLPDWQLPGIFFHELAHQLLYVPGDTSFSESFAMLVEQEGLSRWLALRGDDAGRCAYARFAARRADLGALLATARAHLAVAYAEPADDAQRRREKSVALEQFSAAWARLDGDARRDRPPANNATLGALAAYDQYVPAFREALRRAGGDLPAFYAQARRLGALAPDARRRALEELVAARAPVLAACDTPGPAR
jgi:predicted aminopeptidase